MKEIIAKLKRPNRRQDSRTPILKFEKELRHLNYVHRTLLSSTKEIIRSLKQNLIWKSGAKKFRTSEEGWRWIEQPLLKGIVLENKFLVEMEDERCFEFRKTPKTFKELESLVISIKILHKKVREKNRYELRMCKNKLVALHEKRLRIETGYTIKHKKEGELTFRKFDVSGDEIYIEAIREKTGDNKIEVPIIDKASNFSAIR